MQWLGWRRVVCCLECEKRYMYKDKAAVRINNDGHACCLPRTDLRTIYPVLRAMRQGWYGERNVKVIDTTTQRDCCDAVHSDNTRRQTDAYWTLMWIAHAALDYTCSV